MTELLNEQLLKLQQEKLESLEEENTNIKSELEEMRTSYTKKEMDALLDIIKDYRTILNAMISFNTISRRYIKSHIDEDLSKHHPFHPNGWLAKSLLLPMMHLERRIEDLNGKICKLGNEELKVVSHFDKKYICRDVEHEIGGLRYYYFGISEAEDNYEV